MNQIKVIVVKKFYHIGGHRELPRPIGDSGCCLYKSHEIVIRVHSTFCLRTKQILNLASVF